MDTSVMRKDLWIACLHSSLGQGIVCSINLSKLSKRIWFVYLPEKSILHKPLVLPSAMLELAVMLRNRSKPILTENTLIQ